MAESSITTKRRYRGAVVRPDIASASRVRPRRRRGSASHARILFPVCAALLVIGALGIIYVSQSARLTQATYTYSQLQAQQSQLQQEEGQLAAQLSLLQAPERIDAAAQKLGMVAGGTWIYAHSASSTYNAPGPEPATAGPSQSHIRAFLRAFLGIFTAFPQGSGQ